VGVPARIKNVFANLYYSVRAPQPGFPRPPGIPGKPGFTPQPFGKGGQKNSSDYIFFYPVESPSIGTDI
jgi:hypothetical protein